MPKKANLIPFQVKEIPIKQDNINLIQYSYKVKQGVSLEDAFFEESEAVLKVEMEDKQGELFQTADGLSPGQVQKSI